LYHPKFSSNITKKKSVIVEENEEGVERGCALAPGEKHGEGKD
jgi:hypothetical protein